MEPNALLYRRCTVLPGCFFDHDRGKTHASGKFLFASRVIPYRGSWLDFEFDAKDILNVRIDRKRKLPATTFMMALPDVESEAYMDGCAETGEEVDPTRITGMSREEILGHFYQTVTYSRKGDGWQYDFDVESLKGSKLVRDLVDAKTKEVIATAGTKMTPRSLKKLADSGVKSIFVTDNDLLGRFVADDVVNMTTGEIFAEAGDELTEEALGKFAKPGSSSWASCSSIMLILARISGTRWQLIAITAAKTHWLIFTG
jgi:DNA-directed RNA polymerase subunit beta